MDAISLEDARNLALDAQGFGRRRPSQVERADLLAVLRRMAVVQLDSVNVVQRSHYLPFFARLGAYDRATLDDLLNNRQFAFEQWGHMASVMPIEHFPLLRHRWEGKPHWVSELASAHPGVLDSVLEQVRERGALTIADIEDRGERRGPWWGYGPEKLALEAHFHRGTLTAGRTASFSRVYSLPEAVFPPELLNEPPLATAEAQRELLRIAAGAHGIGAGRDLADYFRIPLSQARPRIRELVAEGALAAVAVEGWKEPGYVVAGVSVPPPVEARALLSPFDPVVWDRARAERLFGFSYRIEIYTPKPKRVFGYYVMPFLLGNQLVGRVDLKANRKERTLEVFGAYVERGEQPQVVAAALAAELRDLATWLGLDDVRAHERGDLATPLGHEVARIMS